MTATARPPPTRVPVPRAVAAGTRKDMIAFIFTTKRLRPFVRFLCATHAQTRPRYSAAYLARCQELVLGDIGPGQFAAFVRRTSVLGRGAIGDDGLAEYVGAWVADIGAAVGRIQAAAQAAGLGRRAVDLEK